MTIVYIILALVVGFFFGSFLKPKQTEKVVEKEAGFISESVEEKQKNLQKLREYLKTRDRVTNNAVEHLLGVSDATTIRYLDELEKEGLIRQVGKTGQSVYYEVK